MKIGINTSPLTNLNKNRGVGIYTKNLIDNILKFDKKNQYFFFEKKITSVVDIIHYPFFDPFFLTLPIIKRFPTIVTIHDLTPIVFSNNYPKGLKGEIKWQIQRLSAKSASAIITDSENSKRDIIKYLNFPPSKTHIVYLAAASIYKELVKGEWENKIRNKYDLNKDFILYTGDVNYNKNLPNLYKAYEKLKSKNLDLVLVGNAKFKAPNGIRELGFVPEEDLVKLYNLAKVLCLPSLYEGFGLPVLEALSCGCQVVSSKNSSLPEIGGNAAFYCDPKSDQDIASKIEEAITSPKDKKILFSQAQKFSWGKTALETIEVYDSVFRSLSN